MGNARRSWEVFPAVPSSCSRLVSTTAINVESRILDGEPVHWVDDSTPQRRTPWSPGRRQASRRARGQYPLWRVQCAGAQGNPDHSCWAVQLWVWRANSGRGGTSNEHGQAPAFVDYLEVCAHEPCRDFWLKMTRSCMAVRIPNMSMMSPRVGFTQDVKTVHVALLWELAVHRWHSGQKMRQRLCPVHFQLILASRAAWPPS